VQLGGQTPLGLARRLKTAGVPIVGTSPESIDLAEDRGAFGAVLARAGLRAPFAVPGRREGSCYVYAAGFRCGHSRGRRDTLIKLERRCPPA